MDYRQTKDTLQEGRSALNELERQLRMKHKQRAPSAPPIRCGREIEPGQNKDTLKITIELNDSNNIKNVTHFTIITTNLTASGITSNYLYSPNGITTQNLYSSSITTTNLYTSSLTTSNLYASGITSTNIYANGITTTYLYP
jgi:hypothetical protein